MLVAERFIRSISMRNMEDILYIQMEVLGIDEACNVLEIETLFTFSIREESNGKSQSIF